MPKSKVDKTRKDNLKKYKEQVKQKQMPQEDYQPAEVRQVPVWKSTQPIEMNGLEFEAIFNYVNSAQTAFAAVQSVMNKNILNGNVQVAFEKLNEDKTAYVEMTEDEQAPHKEQFEQVLASLKDHANKMVRREDYHLEPATNDQEGVPFIDALVDVNGNPLSSVN